MEALGIAHYWGRFAQSLGHRVQLPHPRYVRFYRRRHKPVGWVSCVAA